MTFNYSEAPQRSPEWHQMRLGKPTASRLSSFMARSKRDGKPLKEALDYLQELAFERTFGRSFERFVTAAMQEGVTFEAPAREEYARIRQVTVQECGCFYNDHFVASPDGLVGDEGLVEVKILRDTSFTGVLVEGVPDAHWQQIQGQLLATGRNWCDYVAVNLSTGKMTIIRVEPDEEYQQLLVEALTAPYELPELSTEGVYDVDLSSFAPPAENVSVEWGQL